MKLWHSFTKEILLATRSFYFYIEVIMAAILLFLLLFVVPENFEGKRDQYLYFDASSIGVEFFKEETLKDDEDGQVEVVELEWENKIYLADHYETDELHIYVMPDLDAAIGLADEERAFAGVVHLDATGAISYTYYMQGYETERLLNTLAVFQTEDSEVLKTAFEKQEMRKLHDNQVTLSDRENIVPSFVTFNGSLMGMFILASYIFLDKKEGVIKAYAVTPSPVWQYLLSKTGMVTVTSFITSLIITVPVMGLQPNYLAMFALLITSGFAASALGLLLSSFYDDIMQSFGMLYAIIVLMLLPNIAYFIPTWNPAWIRFIPTYSMLEGFKEAILPNGDVGYIMMTSLAFLVGGLLLFLFANRRFNKTLTI
jgi:hypothetical protein